MAKYLSVNETAALRTIGSEPRGATGRDLVHGMDRQGVATSAPGAHRTAASLVRKNLAWRAGTPKLQWYKITQTGREALAGDEAGRWKARPGESDRHD